MSEFRESQKATGSVRKQLFNEKGVCIYDHTDHNVIVTVGSAYLASYLVIATPPFMSWVGLGTGTTPASSSDTALEIPLPTYIQGTLSSPSSTVWQNVATFGPGVNTNSAITEAGLFSASSSGTMYAHQVFSAIDKTAGATLVVTWQVTF
jgi:hypothetical protein